jgi:hypothetical protein
MGDYHGIDGGGKHCDDTKLNLIKAGIQNSKKTKRCLNLEKSQGSLLNLNLIKAVVAVLR